MSEIVVVSKNMEHMVNGVDCISYADFQERVAGGSDFSGFLFASCLSIEDKVDLMALSVSEPKRREKSREIGQFFINYINLSRSTIY